MILVINQKLFLFFLLSSALHLLVLFWSSTHLNMSSHDYEQSSIPLGYFIKRGIEKSLVSSNSSSMISKRPYLKKEKKVQDQADQLDQMTSTQDKNIENDKSLTRDEFQDHEVSSGVAWGNSSDTQNVSGPVGDPHGIEVSSKERYLYELRLMIENLKTYPRMAKRLRQEGVVHVGLRVLHDGTLQNIQVIRPCEYSKLNDAAIELIYDLGKAPPLPKDLGVDYLDLTQPIHYSLL